MSQVRQKTERVGEIAAKAVVQLLFSTGKSFTVDGLREKLREFFREEVRAELRAVAALSNVELITTLLSCNRQLALVGLQLRITNGVVSLLTTEVNKALAHYLSEQNSGNGSSGLTTSALEVLACIVQTADQPSRNRPTLRRRQAGARCETSGSQACRGIRWRRRSVALCNDGSVLAALRTGEFGRIDRNLTLRESTRHKTCDMKRRPAFGLRIQISI